MGKRIRFADLADYDLGRWTPLHDVQTRKRRNRLVRCRCECGEEREILYHNLTHGKSKSCGCLRTDRAWEVNQQRKLVGVVGRRFGKWLVVREIDRRVKGARYFECRCDCGTMKAADLQSLTMGRSKSCGCSRKAGGLSDSSEYNTWRTMRERCINPENFNYPDYGGRGIGICERWACKGGIVNFLSDMGPRPSTKHSIDRIDNDGDYSPKNCRWATAKMQSANRRNNKLITHDNITLTLKQWSEQLGASYSALRQRLLKGWSVEKTMTTPIRKTTGHSRRGSAGGLSWTSEYTIWKRIQSRCTNPKDPRFPAYGGRGIGICDRWLNKDSSGFINFFADMGPRPSPKHSVDRIDNDSGYSPENCRWATPWEQVNNRKNSRTLTHEGITLTLKQWSERLGVRYGALLGRLLNGWSTEKTLTTPIRKTVRHPHIGR